MGVAMSVGSLGQFALLPGSNYRCLGPGFCLGAVQIWLNGNDFSTEFTPVLLTPELIRRPFDLTSGLPLRVEHDPQENSQCFLEPLPLKPAGRYNPLHYPLKAIMND